MATIGLDDQGYTVDLGDGSGDNLVDSDEIERDTSTPGEVALVTVAGVFPKLLSDNVYQGSIAHQATLTATFTTKQADYNPTNLSSYRRIRWTGAGSTGITSITAQVDGFLLTIENAGTDYLLWLENESGSTAANRISLPNGFPAFLFPGDQITLEYSTTASRWRCVAWVSRGMEMGLSYFDDFITTYQAAAYFNNGTGAEGNGPNGVANWSLLKAQGLVASTTGTDTSGRSGVGATGVGHTVNSGHGSMLFIARVGPLDGVPDGTQTYTAAVGFSNVSAGAPTSGYYWELRWNGSAAAWSSTVNAAGTPTRSTTNAPSAVDTGLYSLGVFVNPAATRADFIYSTDGVAFSLATSASSGLPTAGATMSPCVGIVKSAGTTARVIYTDYIGARVASVRG